MKRWLYISLFGFLGLLLATFLHGVVELWLLDLIFTNPEQFSDTVWWQQWSRLHAIGGATLLLLGAGAGLWAGWRYWRILYTPEGKLRKHFVN